MANTKWNINIKEARDGIKGKCLPKDAKLVQDEFNMALMDQALALDEYYQHVYRKNISQKEM